MARLIALAAALASALVVAASTAAAPPAGTSIQIEQHATLTTGGVIVSVVLQCPAESNALVGAQVQQGAATGTAGFTSVPCTGAKQEVPITVLGPFIAGSANAGAVAEDQEVVSIAQDQRVITIS